MYVVNNGTEPAENLATADFASTHAIFVKTDFAEDSTGHLDHLAALVYLVRAVDRQRNPYPTGFGSDPYNQVVVQSQTPRGSVRALEEAFS